MRSFKEYIQESKCKKTFELDYDAKVFDVMTKKKVGGNYPVGGTLIAKVDKELLNAIKKYYNPDTRIKIGDCIEMNNGWGL